MQEPEGGSKGIASEEGVRRFLAVLWRWRYSVAPSSFVGGRMDEQEGLRRIAEANRLLVEVRTTIYRQREIIARLERMGINSAKQHALLTILIEAYADREEGLAQLLDWLESRPQRQTGREH